MKAQTRYNPLRHRNGEPFNYEPKQKFTDADKATRECQERIRALIESTKRDLQQKDK